MQTLISPSEEKINECDGSDEICNFLKLVHLDAFEARFIAMGVTKIKHLTDVTLEDIAEIGKSFFMLGCMMLIQGYSL